MKEDFQNLSLFKLPPFFRGRSVFVVQLWWIVQSTLFAWSPQFMYGWRRMLLRLFDAKIGVGVLVRPTVIITFPWKVAIGDHSWIGDNVCLYSLGDISIGSNVVISQRSYICTGTHNYSSINFEISASKITIEDKAWLATDVFVAPGVTIGRGSVVGARSSVFNDINPYGIYVGYPARFIKSRFN